MAERGIFCNRTLNLRGIRAVGCDMDYTLIHYHPDQWEQRAYDHLQTHLAARGWPVEGLRFDPDFVTRGLILDTELGNIVKCNRFGYVTRACHGTEMLPHDRQRAVYSRVLVDLADRRWRFINTTFGLSEACMFAQTVGLADQDRIPAFQGYPALYAEVVAGLDHAHLEGTLKQEIQADPDRFVVLDDELPLALLDLKHAGKQLLLITNSEWTYTRAMMSYAFDRFLPGGMGWQELFDLVIVFARKPKFFTEQNPVFEIIDEEGTLRPARGRLQSGKAYLGGDARMVEQQLELTGDQILYIGDHLFADVHVTKDVLRWRTALVIRELEDELRAIESFAAQQTELTSLMKDKEALERQTSGLRLEMQRHEAGYGDAADADPSAIKRRLAELRTRSSELDGRIAPLAKRAGELANPRWGPLLRAGNDKSRMARQLERYADVYMSRVANLLALTPFAYLRAPRSGMPHDR